jgi:hypothetical protein
MQLQVLGQCTEKIMTHVLVIATATPINIAILWLNKSFSRARFSIVIPVVQAAG